VLKVNKSSKKYYEFIRLASRSGWKLARKAKGSQEVWTKGGVNVIIPRHGAKEMPKGLERSLRKQMGF
jgi:predicted RNA binding protein YcfA (HicA-like mRNA interferase family)